MATVSQERRRRWLDLRSPRALPLWVGVLVPPLAWAAHLVLGDLLFELGCADGAGEGRLLGMSLRFWGIAQTIVLAGVTVVAGLFAFGAWRRLRGQRDGSTWRDRAGAFAVAGIASSVFYLAIILYGVAPLLVFSQCGTSL